VQDNEIVERLGNGGDFERNKNFKCQQIASWGEEGWGRGDRCIPPNMGHGFSGINERQILAL